MVKELAESFTIEFCDYNGHKDSLKEVANNIAGVNTVLTDLTQDLIDYKKNEYIIDIGEFNSSLESSFFHYDSDLISAQEYLSMANALLVNFRYQATFENELPDAFGYSLNAYSLLQIGLQNLEEN